VTSEPGQRYEIRFQAAARRGTYRIAYRIDEDSHIVHVLDIDHRSEIYRSPQP